MMREVLDRGVSAAKHPFETVRDWIRHRRKTVMKGAAFERPLDDLGQAIEDVERRAEPPQPPATQPPPSRH